MSNTYIRIVIIEMCSARQNHCYFSAKPYNRRADAMKNRNQKSPAEQCASSKKVKEDP